MRISSEELATKGLTKAYLLRIKELIYVLGKSSQITSDICLVILESCIYHQVVVIFPDNQDFQESCLTRSLYFKTAIGTLKMWSYMAGDLKLKVQ